METEIITSLGGAGGVGAIYALIQYLQAPLKKKVEEANKALSDYRLHVAETYVTKEEHLIHSNRVEKSLTEIKRMIENLTPRPMK